MTRRKKRKKANPSGRAATGPASKPLVHVKIAHVDKDLEEATALVKPALLYADQVTIYSPTASLVTAVRDLGSLTDTRARTVASLDLIQEVPALASQLDADPHVLEQVRSFLSLDPRLLRSAARLTGARAEIDELYEQLEGISQVWEQEMPDAIARAVELVNGAELLVGVQAGAVEIADLGSLASRDLVADSLRGALGDRSGEAVDDLMAGFLARVVEMLTEGRTFPLLDASSSGLVRALEREAELRPATTSVRRGSEVRAAADFMSFLPSFVDLPMDEVLDLRGKLRQPLDRFRAEMAGMAKDFESRPFDEDFAGEIEDAWRARVEPALADIREALAEHRLLREMASVALGDPRRLLAEAGGVVAAAHGDLVSLSGLMTAAVAAGLPAADVAGRALKEVRAQRREVRQSAFYFLHGLGEEAETRSR